MRSISKDLRVHAMVQSIFQAQHFMEQFWGARVDELPTSTVEQCDLLAEMSGFRLLVEEKSKFDSVITIKDREAGMKGGRVHTEIQSLGYDNRTSGIIKKAKGQLESTGSQIPHDFRVIWFTALGEDPHGQTARMLSTLYGSTVVVDGDDFEQGRRGVCYFFRNSEFFRFSKQLDGAVTLAIDSNLGRPTATLRFLLNPLSTNYALLKGSPFVSQCQNGVVDPLAQESAGDAFIVDPNIDRNNHGAVLRHLEGKYGLSRAIEFHMESHVAMIAVPFTEHGSGE